MLWELESVEPTEVQQVVLHSLSISKYSEVSDSYPSTNCEAMFGVELQVQIYVVHLHKSG
jgi:hypothetical protein